MTSRTLAILCLAAALAGCVDSTNAASVQLSSICAPTETCTFSATCSAQYIGLVELDLAVSDQVWLFVQVDNVLQSNANPGAGQTNTNDAHITSFEVTFDGLPIPKASRFHNYRVPAAGSATVSMFPLPPEAGLFIKDNDLVTTAAGRVKVRANVKAKGYYENGSSFESGEFPVNMELCNGCTTPVACAPGDVLVTCPPGAEGQLPIQGSCVTP